jgi:hypothetical protein
LSPVFVADAEAAMMGADTEASFLEHWVVQWDVFFRRIE